jgi:hypothetical protein
VVLSPPRLAQAEVTARLLKGEHAAALALARGWASAASEAGAALELSCWACAAVACVARCELCTGDFEAAVATLSKALQAASAVLFSNPGDDARLEGLAAVAKQLLDRRALGNREFKVVLQPLVELYGGCMVVLKVS